MVLPGEAGENIPFPGLAPYAADDVRLGIAAAESLLGRSLPAEVEQKVALAGLRPVNDTDGGRLASLLAGDVVVEILLSEEMRRGEIERLRREISRAEQEVARSQSKLANENFVNNAPEKVVAGEREKLDVNSRMLETLSGRLDEYI